LAEADATNTFKTISEVEQSATGILRRWLSELQLADEIEQPWREDAQKCWELYQSKKAADNTFNIFWSNVETLRPAIYNSTPRPDVRRRFRDADPVGKVGSKVIERALAFSIDDYDFDAEMRAVVLDTEIVGRGLVRVKYLPTVVSEKSEDAESDADDYEQVADEKAPCAHVQWDDFRHGAAKEWRDVPWVAFRHEFHYDELVEMFGKEKADACTLTEPTSTVAKTFKDDIKTLWQVCEVWEIWDRSKRQVLFVSHGFDAGPLDTKEDPLKLVGFFPMPPPLYAIEDTTTLVPHIPYRKYEQQAHELNRVTYRINKIVNALKVRGAYDASLSEVPQILQAEDQDMIPIQNASQVQNLGGLDKAIWIMPIDKLIQVLQGLIEARDRIIQSIYELTGISDIQRGVANPHETATATDRKTQFGSLRLQRVQRDVQRFVRDILRLKAEIFAEHFDAETLASMTGVQLPTDEDKAKVQQMLAEMQAEAQQTQQPPDPAEMSKAQDILKLPTWKDVMQLLQSDEMRQYRIDIETDSTIAETINRDTEAMMQSVQAIATLASTFAPAIQMGLLSVDVFKTIATRVARGMRMGEAVEDAIDEIKQPPPQPQAAPQDNSVQVAQIKEEGAAKRTTETNQTKLMLAQAKAQADEKGQQLDAMKAQYEAQDAERQRQFEAAEAERQRQHELAIADMEARFDAAIKMRLGEMQQQTDIAGLQTEERMGQQQMLNDNANAAADRDSTERLATQKTQAANLQTAAKIESSDRQTAANIEAADHQTAVKAASTESQTNAKIKSAERVSAATNKSKEKLATAKPAVPKKR